MSDCRVTPSPLVGRPSSKVRASGYRQRAKRFKLGSSFTEWEPLMDNFIQAATRTYPGTRGNSSG